MNRFEARKAVLPAMSLIVALAFVTWAFFFGGSGIFASTADKPEKKEIKEKEIEVKVLDEDKDKSADTEADEESRISPKSGPLTSKDFDQYTKEFEQTQREMEKMMEDMRKEHERMMRDFMGGSGDNDPFGRDDWNITPRFRNMPRGGLFRFTPKDFGTDIWSGDFGGQTGFSTAMDVREDKDKIVITCDLPGMEKDKIEVTLKGRMLTIKGARETVKEEKKDENGGKVILNERTTGGFARTITLPQNVDTSKLTSKYENGVLEIVVPKTGEKEPEEKKIIIKTE